MEQGLEQGEEEGEEQDQRVEQQQQLSSTPLHQYLTVTLTEQQGGHGQPQRQDHGHLGEIA